MTRRILAATAAIIAVCCFGMSLAARAEHVQTVKVRYAANYGMSEWHRTTVRFMRGSELNAATRSLDYDSFSSYASIFFSQDQVAVIKIDSFMPCGSEFTSSCIPSFGNMEGQDQSGRGWEICAKDICF